MNIEKLEEITLLCKKLNLLYVVKNKNNINNNLKYFEDFFNKVTFLTNGLEALEEFSKNKFSILITDIDIEGINGFELIEKAKNINKNIVTIVYSYKDDKESFLKTIHLRIDGDLIPPFNTNNFLEILYKSIENCKEKKEEKEKKKENLRIQKQFSDLVDKNSIISRTDINGIITFVNDNFCKISEYTRDELLGKTHNSSYISFGLSGCLTKLCVLPINSSFVYSDILQKFSFTKVIIPFISVLEIIEFLSTKSLNCFWILKFSFSFFFSLQFSIDLYKIFKKLFSSKGGIRYPSIFK